MKLSREFYIPAGAAKVEHKLSSAVAYFYRNDAGKPCAVGFRGKAAKPAWRYRFLSLEAREMHVAGFFAAVQAAEDAKAASAAADAAKPMPEIGLILSSSWGYDQTNVDFYRVEAVSGRMVELVELEQILVENGDMRGRVVPSDQPKGERFRRQWKGGHCKIASYAWASPWDGRPERFTSYA